MPSRCAHALRAGGIAGTTTKDTSREITGRNNRAITDIVPFVLGTPGIAASCSYDTKQGQLSSSPNPERKNTP